TLPCDPSCGQVLGADSDNCGSGTTLLSTATLTNPIDATLYQSVWLEFDNDWQAIDADDFALVDVSTDGGTTWQNILTFDETDIRNTHEIWDMTSQVALSNFIIRFVSIQPGWDWWWVVDNVCIYGTDIIPVELTSFTASAFDGSVELSWITATETNNQGFEVERSNGSSFEKIGYVQGNGTTTEPTAYTFTDDNVVMSSYSYRLRQIDFDGSFEFSETIEVDVPAPTSFALGQNYPNPFNPTTKVDFSLASDAKVTLKVFDLLGQEVMTVVNTNLVAGNHTVDIDATLLNSGVYFYKIEADAVNGTNFVDVKKMILTK
ncbi:MAG: T9SS type A sorting domain-containing protein, partial [Ignavibacteria bacterium]|nr:T9SS type A sorting domain-containing protein [Ignavibacteria bacterium]